MARVSQPKRARRVTIRTQFENQDGAESFLVARASRIPEHEYEYPTVGVKFAARRGLGSRERIDWSNVIPLDDEPGSRKRAIHVLAFAVDCRIDLVGHAIVTLVSFETNIVRSRHAPQRTPFDLVHRFPYAQVIP
jgi:hypothetical protein